METGTYIFLPYPQTPETAAFWFKDNGICLSRWARNFGFHRNDVTDLLRGKLKGNIGRAHHAAVALGLKPDPRKARRKT
jgi:gp16 family phage-associated protein